MKRIKRLPLGVKRLLLIISIPLSIVMLLVSTGNVNWGYAHSNFEFLLGIGSCLAFGAGTFLSFWIITRLILWVIDGFKESKN